MSLIELGQSVGGRIANWGPAWFSRLRFDRVWLAIAVIFVALALADRGQAADSIVFVAKALAGIAPYLLLAIAIAASAKASGADNLIGRALQGRRLPLMILFSALIGALSPFCSCGVIPLIAAMLSMGVPLPAVMAFWLSSPVMDPSMFVLTTATLGLPFAIGKTAAAIGLGLFGGFIVMGLQRAGALREPLREDLAGACGCGGGAVRDPGAVRWAFWRERARNGVFRDAALANLKFLGKWLSLAFLLESLMLAYISGETIAGLVGGEGAVPVALSALVGVPAYLNGYAALPLVAGLVQSGMSDGAAMAFMVAGGVSSIPAAIAVYALVRRHVFAAYLGLALVGSTLAGLMFGAIV